MAENSPKSWFKRAQLNASPLTLDSLGFEPSTKSIDYSASEPQYQMGNSTAWAGLFSGKDPTVYWTDRTDYRAVSKRLLFECAVSRRCIDIRTQAIASVPITVKGSAASKALFASPNLIDMTMAQAMRVWESELVIGGNLWLFNDERISGLPQLRCLPQFMMVNDPKAGIVTFDPGLQNNKSAPVFRWQMSAGVCLAGWEMQNGSWVPMKGELFHIMEHNPLSASSGSGSGDAVLKEIQTHIQLTEMVAKRAMSGGRAQGITTFNNLDMASMSDDEIARLKSMVRQMEDQKEMTVLTNGATWINTQLSFLEMDVVNLLDTLTRTIGSAFGVDAVELNVPGEASYANKRGADRIFYTKTVKPRAQWLIEQVAARLRRKFDPTLELEINELALPYLQDDVADIEGAMVKTHCYTVNEVRAVRGYAPLPGDQGTAIAGVTTTTIDEAAPGSDPDSDPESAEPNTSEVSPKANTSRRPSEKARQNK